MIHMYHKRYEGDCKRLYFASEASGSSQYKELLAAGKIPPDACYYELQRNDALINELGLDFGYKEAIQLVLLDAANGCNYAKKQLSMAKYDTLVDQVKEEMVMMFVPTVEE